MTPQRIAVIGAGAAGLCSAKYLIQAGHDVTVYEAGSFVGGLWTFNNDNGASIAYQSLHINSEKRFTQFHDFAFAQDVQDFPSHHDMHCYFESFARHFGVYERIQFNSPVEKVEPAGDSGWLVWLRSGGCQNFDTVVVASGHQSTPSYPPFAKDFAGEAVHASSYRNPLPYAGKRVLIVGSGNSGCDIAADICMLTKHTVMVSRSPELIVPKLFLGRPVTQITGLFDRSWLPSSTPQFIRNLITRMVHGRMERWGFTTPPRGLRTHPTSNALLINHIAYRRVDIKKGVVSIDGQTVRFSDGTAEEFDSMICATGYDLTLPFLTGVIEPHDRGLDLYKHVVPPSLRGLYFVGFTNAAGSSNLRMFELQAQLVELVESGEGQLPTESEMREDIAEHRRYIALHYPAGPRYSMEIEAGEYSHTMTAAFKQARARMRHNGSIPPVVSDVAHRQATDARITLA